MTWRWTTHATSMTLLSLTKNTDRLGSGEEPMVRPLHSGAFTAIMGYLVDVWTGMWQNITTLWGLIGFLSVFQRGQMNKNRLSPDSWSQNNKCILPLQKGFDISAVLWMKSFNKATSFLIYIQPAHSFIFTKYCTIDTLICLQQKATSVTSLFNRFVRLKIRTQPALDVISPPTVGLNWTIV